MSEKKYNKEEMNGKQHQNEDKQEEQNQASQEEQNQQENSQEYKEAQNAEETAQEEEKSELEKIKEEYQELNDKYLRLYSELENVRRRSRKEVADAKEKGRSEMITAILPVLDDFERAMVSIKESSESNEVYEGVELIFNKFKNILHEQGVQEMEALGQDFDPEYHEAMTKMQASSEDQKGKVIEEIQKGYLLNDRIVRHAKVVVGE